MAKKQQNKRTQVLEDTAKVTLLGVKIASKDIIRIFCEKCNFFDFGTTKEKSFKKMPL